MPPVVGWYTNDSLWGGLTGYEPWRVGGNKVAWWRKIPGILVIEGRRLDAPAPPLQTDASGYYGLSGFQPSGITFPSTGCWEVVGYLVTVKAGSLEKTGDELRFVVRVEVVGGQLSESANGPLDSSNHGTPRRQLPERVKSDPWQAEWFGQPVSGVVRGGLRQHAAGDVGEDRLGRFPSRAGNSST